MSDEYSQIVPGYDPIVEAQADAVSKLGDVQKLVAQGKVGQVCIYGTIGAMCFISFCMIS